VFSELLVLLLLSDSCKGVSHDSHHHVEQDNQSKECGSYEDNPDKEVVGGGAEVVHTKLPNDDLVGVGEGVWY
jgi:hypothetical protein